MFVNVATILAVGIPATSFVVSFQVVNNATPQQIPQEKDRWSYVSRHGHPKPFRDSPVPKETPDFS
jgi:hypothetical protein